MKIFVVNRSSLRTTDVNSAIKAINTQLSRDVRPHWSITAKLVRWSRHDESVLLAGAEPDIAVMYLQDHADIEGALGYHDLTNSGVPCGFVFTDLAAQLGESWTVTLSHEVLEMIGDPNANLLAGGPHPNRRKKYDVGHWYELCDAVQANTYLINGVEVSNFVLPLYFTPDEEGRPVDFLQTGLTSFGVNPGGYVGFYDPTTGEHSTYTRSRDSLAAKRLRIKATAGKARRAARFATRLVTPSRVTE